MTNASTENPKPRRGPADRPHAAPEDAATASAASPATPLDEALNLANDMAAGAAEKGRAAAKEFEAVAGNFKEAFEKSASGQPLATIAMAALVGFALGALWKS